MAMARRVLLVILIDPGGRDYEQEYEGNGRPPSPPRQNRNFTPPE